MQSFVYANELPKKEMTLNKSSDSLWVSDMNEKIRDALEELQS